VFSLKLTRFKIYNEFLHSIVPNQCVYFIYIITIHFEFDSFQFIKHDLMMMMMMMGENAFYVNTTHLLVVLYVVVRKRLKEGFYILK